MTPNMTYGSPMPAASVKVAYTGTAGTTSAVSANAVAVRIVATTDCFIEISTAGTAAVADTGLYLPALVPEYFSCPPSAKVSAIQVSSGGTVYVTPFC
jgi:hypothetical protein